jgi:hypothetical protein
LLSLLLLLMVVVVDITGSSRALSTTTPLSAPSLLALLPLPSAAEACGLLEPPPQAGALSRLPLLQFPVEFARLLAQFLLMSTLSPPLALCTASISRLNCLIN